MKVLYQWAQRDPAGWQSIDATLWATLPSRDEPAPGQLGGQNNVLGWLANACVQGITCEGMDHVAIEAVTVGVEVGVRLTIWNDDPDDYPLPERQGIVWTVLPLAADGNLGGAINTRQSCVRYCGGDRYARLSAAPPQNTTIRPWAEFIAPPAEITRHGVWLTDAKWAEHIAARTQWGWRHWVDHLSASEVITLPDGRRELKDQRPQGRYSPSQFTLTWFQRDTNRAVGYAVFTHEDALESIEGSGETESATVDGISVAVWNFTTPVDEPNSANWPNGTYRAQLDCTAASVGLTME